MVKRNIKWLLVVLVLGLCPSILHAEDPYGEMKALADSAQKVLGQDRLPSINARWIKLARELNDTVQISDAHTGAGNTNGHETGIWRGGSTFSV